MNIGLKDMEHIRQVYRQSPFVLIHPVGLSALIFIVIGYLGIRFSVEGPLRMVFYAALIATALHMIKVFIIWRRNTYVVTNQRLLIYSQKGLFDQVVVETPHERILNVSYRTEGIVSSMVGYGDVVVQVVGLMEPMILKNIAMPMEIKDYLWEMHKRLAQDKKDNVYGNTDATHIQERVGYTKS
jgi:uncharacterized membrane protein YdbT with pleckstrin-like domain